MSAALTERQVDRWRFSALVARAVVGGLFLISAVGKIIAPQQFVEEIRSYEMVPVTVTNAMGYVLPWLELLAGSLLLICVWRREARLLIAAMLVIFTLAKGYAYFVNGLVTGCGCGGGLKVLEFIYNPPQGLITNVILLALLAVDWRAERLAHFAGVTPPASKPSRTPETGNSA